MWAVSSSVPGVAAHRAPHADATGVTRRGQLCSSRGSAGRAGRSRGWRARPRPSRSAPARRSGSGRTADRNWSARARSTTRSRACPRWRQPERPLAAILGLGPALHEPAPHEPVDQPARRRGRAPDGVGEVGDGRRPAVGEHVERGELGEPQPELAQLEAKPTTSSRHSARPIATRSEIWRTFWIRSPAASDGRGEVGLERRAIAARGGVLRVARPGRELSTVMARAYRSQQGPCNTACIPRLRWLARHNRARHRRAGR